MREAVLDASVVLKWFDLADERHDDIARALRALYEKGRLRVVVPRFLSLEVLNVVGRRWRRSEEELAAVGATLDALRFQLLDPALRDVVRWTARGLTAYDAAYVAVAEAAGIDLVTEDRAVLEVAPGIARPLAEAL